MIGSYTHYLLAAKRWDAVYRETEQASRPAPHVGDGGLRGHSVGDVYPWIVYGCERSGRTLYGVMHAFDGRDTGAHWGIDDAFKLAKQIKADQSTFERLTALMKPDMVTGLHASIHPRDALRYAPGPLLHRVGDPLMRETNMTKTPQEWKEECDYCAALVESRGNENVPLESVESYLYLQRQSAEREGDAYAAMRIGALLRTWRDIINARDQRA